MNPYTMNNLMQIRQIPWKTQVTETDSRGNRNLNRPITNEETELII